MVVIAVVSARNCPGMRETVRSLFILAMIVMGDCGSEEIE